MINSTVKAMQERLNAMGFNTGGVDGVLGPQTKMALKLYQAKSGLPVTGTATSATMAAILKQPPPPVPLPNLRPAPDVLSGGRPNPAPGIPPSPQLRPLIRPEALASPGDSTGPGKPAIPTPNLRPPPAPPPTVTPQPVYLGRLGTPPTVPPQILPQRGPPQPTGPIATVPPGGSFAPPTFDAMRRMDATNGAQGAAANWRYNLPSQNATGMQTGGVGMTGAPPMNLGGSGRPNLAPISVQAGNRGGPPQPTATDAQRQAALAALSAQLPNRMDGASPPPPTQPPFVPSPSNPGYGLPGLPPSPTFPGAIGTAAGAAGGAINNWLAGIMGKPANAAPAPAGPPGAPSSFTPPPMTNGAMPPTGGNLPLGWAPGGKAAAQKAGAMDALRLALYRAMLGARIQQQTPQFSRSDLSIPATPPPSPIQSPTGPFR